MFELRKYIKEGFIEAVGKQSDYWIRLNSAGWLRDGVLLEEDLAEIQVAIDAQYPQIEEPAIEEETSIEIEEENKWD